MVILEAFMQCRASLKNRLKQMKDLNSGTCLMITICLRSFPPRLPCTPPPTVTKKVPPSAPIPLFCLSLFYDY